MGIVIRVGAHKWNFIAPHLWYAIPLIYLRMQVKK